MKEEASRGLGTPKVNRPDCEKNGTSDFSKLPPFYHSDVTTTTFAFKECILGGTFMRARQTADICKIFMIVVR